MIDLIEKNAHGAWVIYGIIGVRQFYGFTKTDAINLYKTECACIENMRSDKK